MCLVKGVRFAVKRHLILCRNPPGLWPNSSCGTWHWVKFGTAGLEHEVQFAAFCTSPAALVAIRDLTPSGIASQDFSPHPAAACTGMSH